MWIYFFLVEKRFHWPFTGERFYVCVKNANDRLPNFLKDEYLINLWFQLWDNFWTCFQSLIYNFKSMVVIYNQSNSLPSSSLSSSSSSSSLLFLISSLLLLLLLLCKHRPILSRRYLSLRLSWMHLIPHCEVSIFLVLSTKHHIFLTKWNHNDFPEFLSQ